MKSLLTLVITLLIMQPLSSFAAHDGEKINHNPDSSEISVKPHEAVIQVKGIVCSFCSLGIQKKLAKLPFVDQTKYNIGSIVDIENQRITIAVKPDKTFDVGQVYKSVLDGGYNPVNAYWGSDNGTVIYDAEGEICAASC